MGMLDEVKDKAKDMKGKVEAKLSDSDMSASEKRRREEMRRRDADSDMPKAM